MMPLALEVIGIGAWSSAHADWAALQRALAGDVTTHAATTAAVAPAVASTLAAAADATSMIAVGADAASTDATMARAPTAQWLTTSTIARMDRGVRPVPTILPAAERRRMPDGVAVAIHVAHEAVVAAGAHVDPTTLASVFASAHGDLAIVDYLCTTLASDPAALSPTRFHLSVHNAAAGYWSIAAHDRAPTSAIAAGDDSFALGLLEAATVAVAEARPVLLVAFDTPATGVLSAAVRNSALFGFAVIVRPAGADAGVAMSRVAGRPTDRANLRLSIGVDAATSPVPQPRRLGELAMSSPAAKGLAFAELLAAGADATVRYPIGSGTTLTVRVKGR
jgi:hypothetical protein